MGKFTRRATIAILALAAITTIAVVSGVRLQSTSTYTTVLNAPFNTTYHGIQVYDDVTGLPLGSQASGGVFIPPTTQHPAINHGYSGAPFFISPTNQPVDTVPAEYCTPVQNIVMNGTVYYVYELRYGLDVAVRTSGNMPAAQSFTSWLAPWYTYTHHFNDIYGNTLSSAVGARYDDYYSTAWPLNNWRTKGVLCGHMDASGVDHKPIYATGTAKVTSSLERIDYYVGHHASVAAAATNVYTLDRAKQRLGTLYGNSRVRVVPSFSVAAAPNFITGVTNEFTALIDGENVTVRTAALDNQVGFRSLYKIPGSDQNGEVQNAVHELISKNDALTPRDNTAPLETDVNAGDQDKTTDTHEVEGSITRLADANVETVSYWIEGADSIAVNTTAPGTAITDPRAIVNYPSTARVSLESRMQPRTDINIARLAIHGEMRVYDYRYLINAYDETVTVDAEIQVPYGITVTNVYNVQRVLLSCYVVVSNQIEMFRADGVPIDPSTFTDYQLNQIIKDPNADLITQRVTLTTFDWAEFWAGGSGWITLVVIAVVVVLVLYFGSKFGWLVMLFKRRGESPAPRVRKSWSIGKTGINYKEA